MEPFQNTGIEGYLSDESCIIGTAEAIVFPMTNEDVQNALQSAADHDLTVTFQGGRTGICGGAVPQGGLIVNFSRMNKSLDFFYDSGAETGWITVQAGFTLEQLQITLENKKLDTSLFSETALKYWNEYIQKNSTLWFLPDPGEKTATLGGIVCTAAGGGHTGVHLSSEIINVTLILSNGRQLLLQRDEKSIDGISVFDAVDAICGSEGLFGAITEVSLALCKKPAFQYGLLGYFSAFSQIPNFMEKLQTALKAIPEVKIFTADFFDSSCAVLAAHAGKNPAELDRYPPFPTNAAAALWLELGGEENSLFTALEMVLAALEQSSAMTEQALAATGRDFERLGRLRHLLTEAANLSDSGHPPVLADFTAPHDDLPEIVSFIKSTLEQTGLIYTFTGHLLFDNISLRFPGLQSSSGEVLADLLKKLAILKCSGRGDHGAGRVKKGQFQLLNPIETMKIAEIKRKLDPAGRLNAGVMVDFEVVH